MDQNICGSNIFVTYNVLSENDKSDIDRLQKKVEKKQYSLFFSFFLHILKFSILSPTASQISPFHDYLQNMN